MTRILIALLTAVSLVAPVRADVLIYNARIVTMGPEGTIDNGKILVRGKVIDAVGNAVGGDVETFDARGAWVTPGLLDSGSQLGLREVESSAAGGTDQRVENTDLGAGFKVSHAINRFSSLTPYFLAKGVLYAIVRPSADSEIFAGQSAIIRLSSDPSFMIDDSNAVFAFVDERHRRLSGGSRAKSVSDLITTLTEAQALEANRRAVNTRRYRELDESRADLEALVPVLRGDKPLAVYVDRAADIETVIRLLDPFGIRVIVIGGREAWKVRELLAAKDVPVILNVMDNLPSNFDRIGARLDSPRLLNEAGVRLAFMTEDQFSDLQSLRQAAGVAVAYGLSWEESFSAVTIDAARIWGIDTFYGSLEKGKQADLVVWDGDPLEVTSAPTKLMIDGKWVDLTTRQTRLRDRYSNLKDDGTPFGYR